jgi:hypothetical protein
VEYAGARKTVSTADRPTQQQPNGELLSPLGLRGLLKVEIIIIDFYLYILL